MAVVGTDNLTLMDIHRSYGEDSLEYQVSELMSIATPVIANLPWIQATDTNVHKAMVRDSLPTVTYGQYNKGTSASKTTRKLILENMGWLEGLSDTDARLLKDAVDPARIRYDQERGFFEAMAQKFESDFFYGSLSANPLGFKGLAPRYNTLSGDIGKYVVSAGGSGSDNASIWIVNHGDDSTQGIVPKGRESGLQVENWGDDNVIKDSSGRSLRLAQTYFKWWVGITVGDYRNNVRIANIDVSDVKADPTGATIKLIDLISDAVDRIPIPPRGFAPVTTPGYQEQMKPMARRTAIYMPRAIYSVLQKQMNNKTNYGLLLGQGAGTGYTNFRDIPFFLTDSLLLTEAAVA
jgi:hypothetical protein